MSQTLPADVADDRVNGREPADLGTPPWLAPLDPTAPVDDEPAKVNSVAGQPRRTLRQRWQDRAARRAGVTAEHTTDEGTDDQDWTRWYPALIALAIGVVLVTFALSFHGLFEAADRIVHLPTFLAIVVPIGIDVFSLCCLVATFLTRDAPWRIRLYCWVMFLLTVTVSVAGNAMYALSEVQKRAGAATLADLRWTYLEYGAVAGAALWPAFSAGALHLLIIARRHLAATPTKARHAARQAARDEAEDQLQRARAIELVAAGETCAAIADQLGVPRRTVERWTAEIRAAIGVARQAAPATSKTRRTS